jgi:hypothetical protein
MLNTGSQIVQSLVYKGFNEEDAKLIAGNIKDRDEACYTISKQTSKSNALLALFMWEDSEQGTEFWLAKFREIEAQEVAAAAAEEEDANA